ncbi:MAG: FAD-dependent oxidoreductase [Chloroflexi bacterium]|nr:FAD-dependent oxidoreductase [Chloroflexota bacterium]
MTHVVIIGAGGGGLAAAAQLARAGLDVTVLEAHIYAGGSAGTFFHQGYRFDAGATLAGGFAPGAPLDWIGKQFEIDWQVKLAERAMQVHLPDGVQVTRWTDVERWQEERQAAFGHAVEDFWLWQESTADLLWDFALRSPNWPPQNWKDLAGLSRVSLGWLLNSHGARGSSFVPGMLKDAITPLSSRLPHNPHLRQFVDGQLLIAAQATSESANALYSSAALDLSRQGVGHIEGGMGALADKLVEAVRRYGGEVRFRQEVDAVKRMANGLYEVATRQGKNYRADQVIFNLPPANIVELLGEGTPKGFQKKQTIPADGWGAFMVYAGVDEDFLPDDTALHHQVLVEEPFAEGNSVFLSLGPSWDQKRAPSGKRALTISTHTNLDEWWHLFEYDRRAYEQLKSEYTQRLLSAAEAALPGIGKAAELVLPGTPVTFQRFTRRQRGWVGGFPQTHLLRAWGPRISKDLWMVGDSIFPGQSFPAVALGGVRVANSLLAELNRSVVFRESPLEQASI